MVLAFAHLCATKTLQRLSRLVAGINDTVPGAARRQLNSLRTTPRSPHAVAETQTGCRAGPVPDPDHPHRLRPVDRRHGIVARSDEDSDRRLARVASIRRHHAVGPRSPVDTVRQDAPRAVVELQCERHRRGGRVHRRSARTGESAQRSCSTGPSDTTPTLEPANTLRPQPEPARTNRCPCPPLPRRTRARRQIRGTLPIRHLIPVYRLTVRGDGLDRDGNRRSRRGTPYPAPSSATTPTTSPHRRCNNLRDTAASREPPVSGSLIRLS